MSRSQRREKILGSVVIMTIAAVAIFFAAQSSFIKETEARSWDWRLHLPNALPKPDSRIVMILLDQESLEYGVNHFGVYWPWPRQMYEAVVKFLDHSQAKAAAFDILFTERSSQNLDDDRDFINAVAGRLPVVSAVALSQDETLESKDDLNRFLERQKILSSGDPLIFSLAAEPNWPIYNSATLPFSELLEVSKSFGNVTAQPDSDGMFRHTVPMALFRGQPVLSLPFALISANVKDAQRVAKINWNNFRDERGRLTINFSGRSGKYKAYHISDIVQSFANISEGEEPITDPAEFRDKYVFIGMSAPGLLDLKSTPLDEKFSGVEVNATIAANLLNEAFVRKPPPAANWLVSIILALSTMLVVFFTVRLDRQLIFIFTLLFLSVFVPLAAVYFNWWLPMVLPLLALVTTLVAAYVYQYYREGRQHKFIRDAFKHYVSPDVINQIIENPKILSLGGEKKELTLFFSDIEGFTSIAEKLPAADVAELLNKFLSEMTMIILAHGGTLDKYVGDAIVAFWNAPLVHKDHAITAVKTALACQSRLKELQSEFIDNFGTALKMRIGIHTGTVSVGNFGSNERFSYSVIGDAANLASRLEGANKAFGTSVLISEATKGQLDGSITLRRIATIKVVGRQEPITVYEPFIADLLNEDQLIKISKFESGLASLQGGNLDQAAECFKKLDQDYVAQAYLHKISHLSDSDIKRGIWNLAEK